MRLGQPEISRSLPAEGGVRDPARLLRLGRRHRGALQLLGRVRVLVRAMAAEIAGRCGQPNGSVAVTLRGLVAQRLVAKTETARGIEFSLISAGSVQPFKRTRASAPNANAEVEAAAALDVTAS
jgi:hypothetical protein